MQEMWVQSLSWEDPLEKGMATHSYILAWEIAWTEEPSGLQSRGSQWIGHDWAGTRTGHFTVCRAPPRLTPLASLGELVSLSFCSFLSSVCYGGKKHNFAQEINDWIPKSQFLLTTLHSWASVSPFTVLSLSKDKNRFYRMTNTIIIEEIFLPPQNIVVLDFNCLI